MAPVTEYGVCALRLSRVANDGTFDTSATGGFMRCGGIMSLQQTDVFLVGDDKEQKDSCGNLCATRKYDDRFKREDLTIELCGDEREIDELVGGLSFIVVGGETVGVVRYGEATCQSTTPKLRTFVEAWVEAYDCDGPHDPPWRRLVFPWAKLTPDFSNTRNGDASKITLKGFTEGANPDLFTTGPFEDLPDAATWDSDGLSVHWFEVDEADDPACTTGSGYVQPTNDGTP